MNFAERNGLVPPKQLQLNTIDESLRNRLFNVTLKFFKPLPHQDEVIEYVADKLGYLAVSNSRENAQNFNNRFLGCGPNCYWYDPYVILELVMQAKREQCRICEYDCHERGRECVEMTWLKVFPMAINEVLEEEKSGYRMVSDKIVPITNKEELQSIADATNSPFSVVNTHMKKALEHYADRESPDYENSIKESISGVESMCCIITGSAGANATLGKAIKRLKDNGLTLHNAMENAFSSLYGYTSDSDGIRHGGIDFTNAPAEDAKYMLVSCSAFTNYLIEKYSIYMEGQKDGQA